MRLFESHLRHSKKTLSRAVSRQPRRLSTWLGGSAPLHLVSGNHPLTGLHDGLERSSIGPAVVEERLTGDVRSETIQRVGLGRLIGRVALVTVIVVLSAGAAAVAWAWWEYEQFAGAAGGAQARLPTVVRNSLSAAGATADSPQVILVRGYGGLATGSTLLVRSDPPRNETAYLTVPRRVLGAPANAVDRPGGPAITGLIHRLARSGINIQHIALLDFSDIGGIVNELGGIVVSNPVPFDVPLGKTGSIHFPTGRVALNGARTAAYLSMNPTTTSEAALREANEQRVLQAVVNNLIRPSNVTQLINTGEAVAQHMETDLTTSDILGLVAARVHTTRVVDCNLSRATSFSGNDSQSALAVFQAKATTSPLCSASAVRPIAGATILQAGAKAVSRYGAYGFAIALAIVMLVIAAGLWLLFWKRSPRDHEAAPAGPSLAARTKRRLAVAQTRWRRRRPLRALGSAVRTGFDRIADAWDEWRLQRRARAPVGDAIFDRLDRLQFGFRRGRRPYSTKSRRAPTFHIVRDRLSLSFRRARQPRRPGR